MYICRHFDIRELVPPEVWDSRGNAAWELLDRRLLIDLDDIRDEFGPLVVNDWHKGGALKYRGFRPADCKVGATYSQHRYGRAVDLTPMKARLDDVYKAICEGYYPALTAVENIEATRGGNWLHVDVRNAEPVMVVNP